MIRSHILDIKITITLAYKSSYAQLRQLKVVFSAFSEDFNSEDMNSKWKLVRGIFQMINQTIQNMQ